MIRQSVKDIYYALLLPFSRVVKPVYSFHYRFMKRRLRKLQIGGGQNYLHGFVNLDANFRRKVDYLFDIRAGLPFPDDSFDLIYSCHMLEHLYIEEAMDLLREMRRVLSPSGYVRLTLPDFNYIFCVLEGNQQVAFPRKFSSPSGMAINFLFCDGQHKYAYSAESLEEIARSIGFSKAAAAQVHCDRNISKEKFHEPEGSFSVNLFK